MNSKMARDILAGKGSRSDAKLVKDLKKGGRDDNEESRCVCDRHRRGKRLGRVGWRSGAARGMKVPRSYPSRRGKALLTLRGKRRASEGETETLLDFPRRPRGESCVSCNVVPEANEANNIGESAPIPQTEGG